MPSTRATSRTWGRTRRRIRRNETPRGAAAMELYLIVAQWLTRRYRRSPRGSMIGAVVFGVLALWLCWVLIYEGALAGWTSYFVAFGISGLLAGGLVGSQFGRRTDGPILV